MLPDKMAVTEFLFRLCLLKTSAFLKKILILSYACVAKIN